MGCCRSAADQTVGDTAKPGRDVVETYEEGSSDSDFNRDTWGQDEETDNEPSSTSMTEESKHAVIKGFKDAVQKGNDSLVMYYVQENPTLNLLDITFPNGDSSLHIAVRNKSYQLIGYLLSNGISPNTQNQTTGETPLHTAARIREVHCVTALLSQDNCKADINITNTQFETALNIASENNDQDIMELLSPRTQGLIDTHIKQESVGINFDNLDVELDDILSKEVIIEEHETEKDLLLVNNERHMSVDEEKEASRLKKLREIQIARNNPFSKLKRQNTQNALSKMQKIQNELRKLPKLEAWLEKRQKHPPRLWQKRWMIVRDSHVLWNDKQRNIHDPKNPQERAKFRGSFNLMCISEVKPVKSKAQRQFTITIKEGAQGKLKSYLWRAASYQDRDYWVKSIKIHINQMKELVKYLGTRVE